MNRLHAVLVAVLVVLSAALHTPERIQAGELISPPDLSWLVLLLDDDQVSQSQETVARSIDFGTILSKTSVKAAPGTATTLNNGKIHVELYPDTLESEVELSILKGRLPTPIDDLIGKDIVYLTVDRKPTTPGDYKLLLPLDLAPDTVADEDLQVYLYHKGRFLEPVDAQIDLVAGVAIVNRPDATVLNVPSVLLPEPYDTGAGVTGVSGAAAVIREAPEAGYLIGASGLAPPGCVLGAPGETHKTAGHAFKLFIYTQTSCDFAKHVSNELQDALNLYRSQAQYNHADGKPTLNHLTPAKPMVVYLVDHESINAWYSVWSWNGYINVSVPLGMADLDKLRDTLFHEMFHAVQDDHTNMSLGGIAALWWYEATAEWAGRVATGMDLPTLAALYFRDEPTFLAIPIQQATRFIAYAYGTMIYPAEAAKNGYVGDALKSWNVRSTALYDDLASTAGLQSGYGDWLRALFGSGAVSQVPWTSGGLFERETVTTIFRPATDEPGAATTPTNLTNNSERYQPHLFRNTIAPLTARFLQIRVLNGLAADRDLSISMQSGGQEWQHAWIIRFNQTGLDGNVPVYRTTFEKPLVGGTVIENVSADDYLLLAVYNPDTKTGRTIDTRLQLQVVDRSHEFTEALCPRSDLLVVDTPGDSWEYTSPFVYDHFENWDTTGGGCYYLGTRILHGFTSDSVGDWTILTTVNVRHENSGSGDFHRCGEPGDVVVGYEDSALGPDTKLVAHSTRRNVQASWVLPVNNHFQVSNMEAVLTDMVKNAVNARVGAACP